MLDLSGQKLGQYELRERLGRGGMAEVYKAYQPGMDRFVAVKMMLGHLADDEGFIARFKREAQSVGKLRHPHIVNVFDFGVERDVYYMVMEYIEGDNLKHYIQKRQAIPPYEALQLTSQMADALAYAHSKGMIHRDLKPANIMFMDKHHQHAVLTDFGIARLMGQSGLTASGMMVGTPAYMSPEAGRGEDTDERSDLYSLGIILYEMVTGNVPYDADTPIAIIMKHINAPLPTTRNYGHHVPPTVEKIIVKSLTKMPADRFQTATEMKKAVDTAIANWSQNFLPDDATEILEVQTDEAATLIQSVASEQRTVQQTNLMSSNATQLPKAITPERKKASVWWVVGAVLLMAVLAGGAMVLLLGGEDEQSKEKTATEVVVAVTNSPVSPTGMLTAEATQESATEIPTLLPTTVVPTEVPTLIPTARPTLVPTSVEVAAVNPIQLSTFPRNQQLYPAPEGSFALETRVQAPVEMDWQSAGLYVALENGGRIEFTLGYCTPNGTTCVGRGIYLDYLNGVEFENLVRHEQVEFTAEQAHLRLTRQEMTFTAEYRADEDENWQVLAEFDVPENALEVGLTAQSASGGAADFNPNNAVPITATFAEFELTPIANVAPELLSGITPLQDEIDTLILTGQNEAALQRVTQLLEENPANSEALFVRVGWLVEQGDSEAAFADADRIIELVPDSPLGYIARADVLSNWPVNDMAGAAQILEEANQRFPENPHILWRLAHAYYQQSSDYYPRYTELFEQAVALGASGMGFTYFAGDMLYNAVEDYERAEPYLQLAHSSQLKNEFTLIFLARTLIELGRTEEALEIARAFEWGDEFWWGNADATDYAVLAYIAYRAGAYEQATTWAQNGMALSSEAYSAQYVMGLTAWAADGDVQAAMSYLDPLLEVLYYGEPYLTPRFGHTVRFDRAKIFAEAGLHDEALAAYTLAIEEGALGAAALEGQADSYLALGDSESALNNLREAFSILGNDSLAERERLKQKVVDLYWGDEAVDVINPPIEYELTESELSIPILSGLNPTLDEFDALLLTENLYTVLEIVNERLAAEPDNIELLAVRALISLEILEVDAARADANRIIELAPENPLGFIILFEIAHHWSVDDAAASLENAQLAYTLAPENPETVWRLAWAYWRHDRDEEAEDTFHQALDMGARGYRYALAAGMFWYTLGDDAEAIEPLKTYSVARPSALYEASHLLGALIQTEQTDFALQLAYSMTDEANDERGHYMTLAYTAYRAGDYEQAQAWAQVVIAFSSDDVPEARYLLALLKWYQDGDLAEALAIFAAIEGTPYEGFFMNMRYEHNIQLDRARIAVEAEDYETALAFYTAATNEIYTPFVYEERADVYLVLGDVDAAREDLRAAADIEEDEAERQRLFERILELGPEE